MKLAALGGLLRRGAWGALACLALAAVALPAAAQPAIWVVRDADSTIYLFGTIHLLKPETSWRSDRLDGAISSAQELWLELPTTDPTAMQADMGKLVRRHGLAPQTPLSQDLTPEEMKTLDEAARLAGLTASQLNVYRPWFAALTLEAASMTRAGYDDASGVDRKIEALFRARGIAPHGLETIDQQIGVFAGMSREQELRYLRETLEEYERAPVELDAMVSDWAKGDVEGLETLIVEEMKTEGADLYQLLLVDRNAVWTRTIAEMLKGKGTIFIAVGAAHLIGPDSVLAMLQAQGIASQRLQ